MNPVTPYSEYDPFARVYNRHWGSHFIPLVMPILESQVLTYLPDKAAILDLCCGTGQLARTLCERGYRVTGLDGSSEMLGYARQNAPAATLINEDARSFNLPQAFQAVISTFDSLNHILELEELASVFANVLASLKPGGIFLFDLNMEAGFRAGWNRDSSIVEEDHICVIRESYNQAEGLAHFYATIFYQENGWQRTDFALTQKSYPASEIISSLEKTGFSDIRACAYDIRNDLMELTPDTERGFFISKKPL